MKSAQKSAYFALSVLLVACTSAPPLQSSNPVSDLGALFSKPDASKPVMKVSDSTPSQQSLLNQPAIEQAQASLQSNPDGDRLQLSVQIKKSDYQIQRLELERIKNLKAWVKGPGISGQIDNLNNFVTIINQNQATTLDITKVPRGKHRIVTVQGYQEQANGNAPVVSGATLKAVYDSPANSTEVVLNFNWRSTAEAEIIEALLALAVQDPDVATLLDNLDKTALGALLDKVIYGANPVGGSVYNLHPDRLNPSSLADILVQANGVIPDYSVGDPVPLAWQDKMHDATLTIRTPGNVSFSNSDIRIQITDPASAPIVISNNTDTVTIPQIVPGTWDAVVSIDGLNGGVSTRATITVNPDGTAILTTGEPTNPIVLPPVIKAVNTAAVNAGDEITLTGDGFDAATLANNVVKFGDTVATVVSVTATAIVVKVPPGVTGTPQVTVTSNTKTSNQADVTVPVRLVTLSSFKGVVDDAVTITVTGYDPTQTTSTVRFNGSVVDAQILSVTNNTIRVKVPNDATTGGITVTPTGLNPLTSPIYTIGQLPTIISVGPDGPYVAGQTVTVTGVNIENATTVSVNGTNAVFTVNGTNPAVMTVTIPAGASTGPLLITTPVGTTSVNVSVIHPPTITNLVPPNPGHANPSLSLIGSNYLPVNKVTIGGVTVPAANYAILNDTSLNVSNVSTNPVLGPIRVTNAAGTAIASLTYSNVVNFIGNTGSALNTAHNFTGFCGAHGVNVDNLGNIYVSDIGCSYSDPFKAYGYSHSIHKFTAAGVHVWSTGSNVTSLSTGKKAPPGLVNGTIANARFDSPEDTATDLNGNIYVADTSNHAIRKITAAGQVVTLARLPGPEGIEIGLNGKLYVTANNPPNGSVTLDSFIVEIADLNTIPTVAESNLFSLNDVYNTMTPNVTLLSGREASGSAPPASASVANARYNHLEGLGIDGQGRIYVAELTYSRIRRIDPATNTVTVFADLSNTLNPTTNNPKIDLHEIRVDRVGNVFIPSPVARPANGVYHISPEGNISLIAGSETGSTGLLDGDPLKAATFSSARGIDFGLDGALYIADTSWGVRKIERFHPVANLQVP